ncbi:E3 ubiquitin/ISG15 ligase TRIM25-like [Dendropsophus ebraccatus]|uniref:E3 ubiquitin/ISG15 ligase TRIM25-like n=1 Tax=Dendropsophus ebraccatus TaxID=150705 RepID=UPI0038312B06
MMAAAEQRDKLTCPICLDLYTDPVTLWPCGHNFCDVCIVRKLNAQEGSGSYSCPECTARFLEKPPLQRNTSLCGLVEYFLSIQPHKEEVTAICCAYCVDSPVPAVKTCLKCEASLCDKHLRVHSKSEEHVLIDPRGSLDSRKCPVHKKILEYYCTKDAAYICTSCTLSGIHRGHPIMMLDVVSKKKKVKLRDVLENLTKERDGTEEIIQSLKERKRKVQETAAGEAERVTGLVLDIRRRLDDLEKTVLSEISRQEEQLSLLLTDATQNLEMKKDELSRKMRHKEKLCNTTDPLTVLQDLDIHSDEFYEAIDYEELNNLLPPDTGFISPHFSGHLSSILTDLKKIQINFPHNYSRQTDGQRSPVSIQEDTYTEIRNELHHVCQPPQTTPMDMDSSEYIMQGSYRTEIELEDINTDIQLSITDKDTGIMIWSRSLQREYLDKLRTIITESTSRRLEQPPVSEAKHFVQKNYESLCRRLGFLSPILLSLRAKNIINEHEEEVISKQLTSLESNHVLLDMIKNKGAEEEFYDTLQENDPPLIKDLKRSLPDCK